MSSPSPGCHAKTPVLVIFSLFTRISVSHRYLIIFVRVISLLNGKLWNMLWRLNRLLLGNKLLLGNLLLVNWLLVEMLLILLQHLNSLLLLYNILLMPDLDLLLLLQLQLLPLQRTQNHHAAAVWFGLRKRKTSEEVVCVCYKYVLKVCLTLWRHIVFWKEEMIAIWKSRYHIQHPRLSSGLVTQ